MNLRRTTASAALAAVLVSMAAVPALAEWGPGGSGFDVQLTGGLRISNKFEDMADVPWGLSDVTKLYVKGIFKGQGERLFAPRANISHQETAVAIVRLLDLEAEAKALTEAEVAAQLKDLSDAKQIAPWARPSVAMLIKSGIVSGTEKFGALKPTTRLETAVWLVKAMGWEAEAQSKMTATLNFRDAAEIPAHLVGYAAVAADHGLILGVDGKFVPHRPVMRVEMAIMLARADRILEDEDEDDELELEFHGVVKAVDAAAGTVTLNLENGRVHTFRLAADAAIFVNGQEKGLADLTAGMKVELKLNAAGEVLFLEARSEGTQTLQVKGSITSLTAASATSLALVGVNGTIYALSGKAPIILNGEPARFADLQVGDAVKATVKLGMIINLHAERTAPKVTTVTGTVKALAPATSDSPATISVDVTEAGQVRTVRYHLADDAVVVVNGAASRFADLQVGENVTLTLTGGVVTKIAVLRDDRTVIEGNIIAISVPVVDQIRIPELQGTVTIGYVSNGSYKAEPYQVLTSTEIKVNGQPGSVLDLKPGDQVRATLAKQVLTKLEITR